MTGVVFDSSAVVTFLIQERGWQAIHRVVTRVGDAVMAGPALTEAIAVTRRKGNQSSGDRFGRPCRQPVCASSTPQTTT